MRPYKRATLIARSIIKMIEDSGGGSAEVSKAAVLLPATVFDDLLRDQNEKAGGASGRLRIRGIAFERNDYRAPRRRHSRRRDA